MYDAQFASQLLMMKLDTQRCYNYMDIAVRHNFSVTVFSGLILYLMSYRQRDTTEDRNSDISCHEYSGSLVVLIYVMDHNTCVSRYFLILKKLTYINVLNESDTVAKYTYFICDTVFE